MMLKPFDKWPDVLEHVRAGRIIYYVPEGYTGVYRTFARVVPAGNPDKPLLRLRCASDNTVDVYPSTIADESFLDKLYRWEVRRAVPH